MENNITRLIEEGLGMDLGDPNLTETPKRIAKMYKDFFTNYGKEPSQDILKRFPNDKKYDEIVLLDNIPFTSICSHHFLPFQGFAWFAYLPGAYLIGASKPARLIHFYSKKPQLQENLAKEIIDYFVDKARPQGAMLVMRAVHGCMATRGACTGPGAGMVVSATFGAFRDNHATRMEALELIRLSRTF
ncbi:MAG: GTP cyclohydrolase I [Dehalococcoidales bacterium]|jgi:GTP cyclohydrolase I